MHPSTLALLRWFEYDHLPEHLQQIARPFAVLAGSLAGGLAEHGGAELTTALRKLLEAKDCAVRAAILAADS